MNNRIGMSAPTNLVGQRRRQRPGPVTVVTVVGTAFLALVQYARLLPRCVILAIDVPEELGQLCVRSSPSHILFTISAGRDQTVQSIVKKYGTAQQLESLYNLPRAGSGEGMAQIRCIGGAAMHQLLDRHETKRLIREQIIPMLHMLGGGEIAYVHHLHFQGTAGGMGSEGGIVLFDYMTKELLADNHVVIHSEVHILGGISFNGPDFLRVRENSAASVASWIHKCRHPAADRVWTTLYCQELYPVGKNKPERDAFLLEQHQALMAPAVANDLKINRSNETVSGKWGNVRLVQSDHFRALSAKKRAADIAANYRPIVDDVLRTTADLGRVEALRWKSSAIAKPRESVEGALERVLDAEAQEIIESVSRPGCTHKQIPFIVLKDGRTLWMDNVRSTFATPLRTVQDARERMCLLRTCRLVCKQEAAELRAKAAELEREIEKLERQVMKSLSVLQGWWVLGLLTSDERKIEKAFQSLNDLQQACDALHEIETKLTAIESSLTQLARERADLSGKLKSLSRLLRRALPHGDARHNAAVIEARPIDELFADLLDLVERQVDVGEFVHLLLQGVQRVKPRGLAEIVGAPDTSIEAIVRAVVAAEHVVHGPNWGGLARDDQARRFIVFPPVDLELARGIAEQHQSLPDTFGTVAFAETALGSVNVVILEVTSCREIEDVWVPYYQKGLARACESPMSALYVSDTAPLRELGLLDDLDGQQPPADSA